MACRHLNMWLHTLVELWRWHKPAADLTDRGDSPWDDAERRPSHADRRKALRAAFLAEQFSHALRGRRLPRSIREAVKRLLRIVV